MTALELAGLDRRQLGGALVESRPNRRRPDMVVLGVRDERVAVPNAAAIAALRSDGRTFVLVCTGCPWTETTTTEPGAHLLADSHRADGHPVSVIAQQALKSVQS